jgi:hypothetical protein
MTFPSVTTAGIRESRAGILALLVVGGAFLIAFPARILECDAVIFAHGAVHRDLSIMSYPHHLGFNLLEYAASLMTPHLDPPLSPIYILQYLSMAAGLGGVYLLYRVLVDLGVKPGRSVVFSGALLFSYGYWHYSAQAEVHILSSFLLILFALLFCRFLEHPSGPRASMLGGILGLATVMHQSNILMLPPVLAAFYLRGRQVPEAMRALRAFAVPYVLIGILPYPIVAYFVAGRSTVADFHSWLTGASRFGAWGGWAVRTPLATAVGLIRNFTGSHYLLAFKPVARLADRTFPVASLADEMAVGTWGPRWLAVLLASIQVIVLGFTARALLGGPRRLKNMVRARPAFALFVLGWLAILGLFFTWWAPERVDFWIAWLPALLILLAYPAGEKSGRRTFGTAAVLAFLAGLFGVNFLGSIYPQSGPIRERDTEAAVAVDAVVRSGDVVVSDCYFAGRASNFARSFERVNLLDDILAFPSTGDGTVYAYADGRRREAAFHADPEDDDLVTRLEARTVSRIDSLVVVAADEGRIVYLLMGPVSTDPARTRLYGKLVHAIERRYDLSHPLPIWGLFDLRRIAPRSTAS